MAEPTSEQLAAVQQQMDNWLARLNQVRDERLDLLPEAGTLIEHIADAMNALELAYLSIKGTAEHFNPTPQGATFIPNSNPKDARQL